MNFTYISKNSEGGHVVDKPGRHVFFVHNYSGVVDLTITTKNAEVYIFGLYVGKDGNEFKLNTIQRHSVGNSVSDLLIKGVFFDRSKFVYEGLIKIDKGAQKSNAYQKNQNLILSKDVFVDSRPYLEILANDVRCTHGSTTGKINEEELLYLGTRGINRIHAEKLIVEGFILDIFSKMEVLGKISELDEIKKQCLPQ